MRSLLLLLVAALAVSCGDPASQISQETSVPAQTASVGSAGTRYGLAIAVPNGWDEEIARGAVRFANRALPGLALCGGPRELGPGDLVVDVLEREPQPGERWYFPQVDEPPRLSVHDFKAPERGTYPETHGYANVPFSLNGRYFVIFAESGDRSVAPRVVDEANAALATLTVAQGDFYPGEVEPAAFAAAADWHTGSSGPMPVHADGDLTTSWAATVPYRDEWDAVPYDALQSLPNGGIVIWIWLSRSCEPSVPGPGWRAPSPTPYWLADFEVNSGWEGQVRDILEYVLWTRVEEQYDVDLRAYFGRPDPTEEMLARAQDELDRLRLPDWGPWELE